MKKKVLIVSGIILIAASLTTGVFAATKYSLIVNGTKINTELKIIDGTTYVPLRTVSEALGAKVSISSNVINITTPAIPSENSNIPSSPTKTLPESSITEDKASRTNPANLSEKVNFTTNNISEKFSGNLTILETVRGEDAWKAIYSANYFNSEPEEGYEYILAKIKIDINSNINADAAVSVSSVDFTLVSSSGVDYKHKTIVVPSPDIRTKIYAGGSQTGWVAFQVKKDDQSPLIVYGRKYDGSSGIWFKTK
ncbi:Telomeric repeat-binding factor 2 [compost metagenome]